MEVLCLSVSSVMILSLLFGSSSLASGSPSTSDDLDFFPFGLTQS